MGLMPSSRRRQSRDLRDYVSGSRGHGQSADRGQRRATSGRTNGQLQGQQTSSSVRLVRMRTRSDAEVEHGIESKVLQNGAVDVDRELRKLLKDTQPVGRWQERLKRLLSMYIRHEDALQALAFLEKNMDTAIVAVEDPSQSRGYPALFIDVRHKPAVFDLDHWKDIMISLHFELTEPESNRHLDLVEVKVTKQVTLGSLLGFKFLLHCLSNVSSGVLHMLLALTTDEALRLLTVMQTPPGQRHSQADLSVIQNLYARYPDQVSALGFSVTKNGKKKEWHLQQSSHSGCHHDLEVALLGLFHRGLETHI